MQHLFGPKFHYFQPDTTLHNINCTELVKETACTLYIHDNGRVNTSKYLREKIIQLKYFHLLLEVQAAHDVV